MAASFQPTHMPCTTCGASVPALEREGHVCDAERALDYALFQLRDEVAGFGAQLAEWLASPTGRFECWYAERRGPGRSRPADG